MDLCLSERKMSDYQNIRIKYQYFKSIFRNNYLKMKINYKNFKKEYDEYKNLYNIRNHQNITEY